MRKTKLIAVAGVVALAGCAQEPLSPAQQVMTQAAYLDVTTEQCAAVSGFGGLTEMQQRSADLQQKAVSMGAAAGEIENARNRVRTAFAFSSGMQNRFEACNDFMGRSAQIMATT